MSVCLETSSVLATQVSTQPSSSSSTNQVDDTKNAIVVDSHASSEQSQTTNLIATPSPSTTNPVRTITKLPNAPNATAALQKASLITVLNTPLGNVKTLCVTPAVSSNATGQFTVVNSATTLNVANSQVKPQTITLINTPVTVVKTISPSVEKSAEVVVPQNNSSSCSSSSSSSALLSQAVSVVAATNINNNNNNNGSVTQGAVVTTATAAAAITSTNNNVPALIENRGHNVFVKNTNAANENITLPVQDIPQSHKLLTANNFPTNNVLTTAINVADLNAQKTANGQRNKVKILSNVLMPGTSQSATGNIILNKQSTANNAQRFVQRQKIVGPNNGVATKYLNKAPNHIINKTSVNMIKQQQQQQMVPLPPSSQQPQSQQNQVPAQRLLYPTHKSQIKTLSPMGNYVQGKASGIKTLSPHTKPVPGQVQRTGTGLKTIPPQRQQKMPNKPNYIGKHAVQAHKLKQPHKMKSMKNVVGGGGAGPPYANYHIAPVQEKPQMTFNQALTAEILETLSNNKPSTNISNSYGAKSYEIMPPRYDNNYFTQDIKANFPEPPKSIEERAPKSGLDTLSLICQAVLLDHNYNATLPPESPTRSISTSNTPSQINGVSPNSMYSPGSGTKRRTLSGSNPVSSSTTSLSTLSVVASNSNSMIGLQDDDAASDISDGSDRKQDTEGEETDTAPEAEAVNNEDQFGDYVTRCICGFIHDDGYMIECDRCKVWQHVQCVVKNRQVPEEYLCELCDPHKQIDRHKARLAQQQWLRDRQFVDPKLKKDLKLKEVMKQKETMSDTDSSDNEQNTNNNVVVKGRPSLMNRRKSDQNHRAAGNRQRRDSGKDVAQKRSIKKRERKVTKRKTKAQMKNHSDDENHDNSIGSTQSSAATTTTTSSSSSSGNNSNHLPQLRQWIENYEEAVTNHYSPELRARISNIRVNGAHTDTTIIDLDTSINKCRVHTQPLTDLKYLVSTVQLAPNTPVIELRGKYMLSAQHRNSGNTFNTRQHAQRPGPFLFFYRLHKDNTEVCVDTRTYGNSARFIRRSCKPNAELRHSIVKGVLHLYIVSIADVDKNVELTIKHESHDLAAIGTTQIACACGDSDECTVNKTTTLKKNGDNTEIQQKKRRGRRTNSLSNSVAQDVVDVATTPTKVAKKETATVVSPVVSPPTTTTTESTTAIKQEASVDVKKEESAEELIKNDVEIKQEVKFESKDEVDGATTPSKPIKDEKIVDKEQIKIEERSLSPPPQLNTPITTRRTSQNVNNKNVDKDEKDVDSGKEDLLMSPVSSSSESKNKNKKLSREERKLEAILRAIAQMEKADQRKQEHQAKQAHRRESEPGLGKDDDKMEPKMKRKRRKGRARTSSTHTPGGGSGGNRRNRLNSTDSYLTSGDETMLSPNDNSISRSDYHHHHHHHHDDKDVGLLLALSNGEKNTKSPGRGDADSNSNSAQSSPETQLSSACLLVQAAVEPMEQGFKFPKTKKGLMNEWLNKGGPEPPIHSASSISPSSLTSHINNSTNDFVVEGSSSSFYNNTPSKSLAALAQVASFCDSNAMQAEQPRASAKKRWLRQAISEDQCDSPSSRPESPPLSETIAPPKKRRLPRESLSNDITPPTTPTSLVPPIINNDRQNIQEGCVEIVYSGGGHDDDSPQQVIESDSILEERVAEMKEEFNKCLSNSQDSSQDALLLRTTSSTPPPPILTRAELPSVSTTCLMDPRLTRSEHHNLFSNSEHLVGTVEKTLSIFGFEDRKPEAITPAKRKLSITEYRQRKKLNNNDKCLMEEQPGAEEHLSSESFKPLRTRSNSTSSCTSVTSSDEEPPAIELAGKAPSAFNSEPTELERQREITSMRLKKAFGIAVDDESRKPALDVEAILNCDIAPIVKTIPPSPTFPIPGSSDVITSKQSSPIISATTPYETVQVVPTINKSPIIPDEVVNESQTQIQQKLEESDELMECDEEEIVKEKINDDDNKRHMFYTPDEEEEVEEEQTAEESVEVSYEEIETVDYVPPFNNPIYPNDSNFTSYASVIDEDGRYEGRNPSPPPDLGQQT